MKKETGFFPIGSLPPAPHFAKTINNITTPSSLLYFILPSKNQATAKTHKGSYFIPISENRAIGKDRNRCNKLVILT